MKAHIQIRAIVFDLGGVLFSEGKSVAMEQLAREHAYDPELIDRVFESSKSFDLRRGLITDEEFWDWVKTQVPEDYDSLLVKNVWYRSYVLDEDIVKLIKKLRAQYQIVAFSGNIKSRIDFLEERYRFRQLFDKEIYSFEHHVTKPEKAFVEILVSEVKCKPEEIVYVDDNDAYTKPAREMGLKVLIYSKGEVKKLERELALLGV
jgi:putative hydrolase of the HAD superfamily